MNNTIKRLPDSELEIMKIIWAAGGPVRSAYIQEQIMGKKNWAACTILGFLSRLVEKGFLTCTRQGKFNIYEAVVDQQDYLKKESKSIFEKLYGNSLKTFVSTLYDSKTISDDDLEELKKYIEETKGRT